MQRCRRHTTAFAATTAAKTKCTCTRECGKPSASAASGGGGTAVSTEGSSSKDGPNVIAAGLWDRRRSGGRTSKAYRSSHVVQIVYQHWPRMDSPSAPESNGEWWAHPPFTSATKKIIEAYWLVNTMSRVGPFLPQRTAIQKSFAEESINQGQDLP